MGEDDKKTFPPKFTMMRNTRRLNRGKWLQSFWSNGSPKRGVPMGLRRFQRTSVTTTAISR